MFNYFISKGQHLQWIASINIINSVLPDFVGKTSDELEMDGSTYICEQYYTNLL